MKTRKTDILDGKQKTAVLTLWNNEYPSQLAYPDVDAFNEYLDNLIKPVHYLLTSKENLIVGWAFTFERENNRWFAIIVDSRIQRKGYGSMLLSSLKADNPTLFGWVTDHDKYVKADGSKYMSPLNFYLKNGFTLIPDQRFETNLLSAAMISFHSQE